MKNTKNGGSQAKVCQSLVDNCHVNPNCTFSNFIIGESNKLAHSVAHSVAEQPFHLDNPLFLYGSSGLGKTHLLFAIINKLRASHPEYNILYVTAEEFTNELVASLVHHKPMEFREKYRNPDILLVDDVQFIAGRMAQEEFAHTFEALLAKNKQLIVTSTVAPCQINSLEERLKTRLSKSTIVNIQHPDFELRKAIIKRKSLDCNLELGAPIISYLAEKVTDSVCQIEGIIKRLRAQCFVAGPCSIQMADDALCSYLSPDLTSSSSFGGNKG